MDTNGTRFQLLQGYHDWASCSDTEEGQSPIGTQWQDSSPNDNTSQTAWDYEQAALTLKPRLFQTVTLPVYPPPHPDERRGAACDRYGNWYWIDQSNTELLVRRGGYAVGAWACPRPGSTSAATSQAGTSPRPYGMSTLEKQSLAPTGTGNTCHFWSPADGIAPGSGGKELAPFLFLPAEESTGKQHAPFLPLRLSALTVTEDHYLVVGILQPAGILIFDLFTSGLPQLLAWPDTVHFAPFDMAAKPGGGLWILDRDNTRYWALDRHFHVIKQDQEELVLLSPQADTFHPIGESPQPRARAQIFPAGISLSTALPLAISNPIAIEALPDDTVLILDSSPHEPFSRIYRYHYGQPQGLPVSTDVMLTLIEKDQLENFRLSGYDFAFVPEHQDAGKTIPDRLYIVPTEGNQVYAFNISQQDNQLLLQSLHNFFPLRMFGGKGLIAAGYQVYYDFSANWVPVVEQRRPHYTTEAIVFTPVETPRPALDGKTPDCVWHRLMLDASIPPETDIQIWSRCANEQGDLTTIPWREEPHLYLRSDGSELPFTEKVAGEGNGTWELLLQDACGRYLQLKIKLLGNGRSTPRLRAMRIYYPRFSYLAHYLPAIYRADSQSASFLDRFLANIEGFYTAIEDKIAAVQMLFDPRSAPPEALDWLASWLGIAFNLNWDTYKRRLFLKHAMEFFQYRGTACALQMILHLTLDPHPNESTLKNCLHNRPHPNGVRIIEKFQTIVLPARNTAHQFTVLLPTPPTGTVEDYQNQLALAQRIIDMEKPTHTTYEVKFYSSAFRIGTIRLGLDTFIDRGGRSPEMMAPMILGQGSLLENYLASAQYRSMTNRAIL